ncbi:MAG: diacylglycerol kinase family protein [Ferruginibacter sp.]
MIAILVNPAATTPKAFEVGQQIHANLLSKNIEHVLFTESWPGTLKHFTEAWIVGGDGTINYYLNYYRDNSIPISVFSAGTGNDFAWKLYKDMPLKEQVDYVLQAQVKYIDTGICNDMFYVNSSGIGFDGEVLKSMKSIRRLGGHLGYLWIVIKKIFSFKEFSFKIRVDDKSYDEKFLLVAINNSSRTGGGFFVTPSASLTDEKLDLLLCKPLNLFSRLRYLPVIEKGKHLDLAFIETRLATNISIETSELVYAQLDGELVEGRKFIFSILPGWLGIKY